MLKLHQQHSDVSNLKLRRENNLFKQTFSLSASLLSFFHLPIIPLKLLTYPLKVTYVPKVVRVPQFENRWCRL